MKLKTVFKPALEQMSRWPIQKLRPGFVLHAIPHRSIGSGGVLTPNCAKIDPSKRIDTTSP